MSKGFSVERNLNVYTHRPTYKIVSLEKEDENFINVLKQMRLWYATEDIALERCRKNQEREKRDFIGRNKR